MFAHVINKVLIDSAEIARTRDGVFQARARRRSRRRGPPETQLAHLQHFGRALVQREVNARRRGIVMIRALTRLRGRERLARGARRVRCLRRRAPLAPRLSSPFQNSQTCANPSSTRERRLEARERHVPTNECVLARQALTTFGWTCEARSDVSPAVRRERFRARRDGRREHGSVRTAWFHRN